MLVGGEPCHSRHRVALASGYEQHQLVFIHLAGLRGSQEYVVRHIELAQAVSRFHVA